MWQVKITFKGPFRAFSNFESLEDAFKYIEMQDYYSISEVMLERIGDDT